MKRNWVSSVFLHPRTFWIGIVLLFGGLVVPDSIVVQLDIIGNTLRVNGHPIRRFLITLGNLIITGLLLVSSGVILRTAYESWRDGYAEGRG